MCRERSLSQTKPAADQRPSAAVARLDLSLEALAARILARHGETVRVKKAPLATKRLARIVECTLALANRVGFHSMSLRDLSQESGLSMGALYAYFDSKETLLLMILGTVSEVVEEALGEPPGDLAGREAPTPSAPAPVTASRRPPPIRWARADPHPPHTTSPMA